MLVEYEQCPFAHYMPCTIHTEPTLKRLAALKPRTHGNHARLDGKRAIADLAQAMKMSLREPR